MANTQSSHYVAASTQSLSDTSNVVCEPASITIEAWIKPTTVSARKDIVGKKRTGGTVAYLLAVGSSSGRITAFFQNPASVSLDSNYIVPINSWTHVAVTYDGTTAKIYINGNATADNTVTLSQAIAYAGTFPVFIGNSDAPFDGDIDDVRIWNVVRTGAQIAANFGVELVGNETGLVSYWKLNNALTDSTANANNLTNNNVVTFTAVIPFITNVTTDTRYWVGGTGSWNTTQTSWALTSGGTGGVSVPLLTSPVIFNGSSGGGTATISSSVSCSDVTFTGYTGTLAGSSALAIYGNLTLASGMTITYTGAITFGATSTGKTITSDTKLLLSALTFNGSGGGWTLQDNMTAVSITLTLGALSLSSKTITLTGSGTPWSAAGGTLSAGTSTIKFTDASSSSKTFAGGSLTYYNLYITGSGTGTYTISGSNTFNDFKVDTPPHTVNFTAGTNQTVTTFTVSGTVGNLITLQSTSAGSTWYLTKSGAGTVTCDYLSLKDSHAS